MISLDFLEQLGLKGDILGVHTGTKTSGGRISGAFESLSPVDGQLIGKVWKANEQDYQLVVEQAQKAFEAWRKVPAPQRGEVVRQIGMKLREFKEPLGKLVSY
ncbi:MAG: aldehyde dehydrogenase family protein, partial [Proteobacteria bacterium]|nr:aldehyde dehydrogenase family protein [Pseudomonadota bacterium]